jgi:hypothetical protein
MLVLRDYLNEGGRLLYMGRDAGRPYTSGAQYDPVADGACVPNVTGPAGLSPVGDEGGGDVAGSCAVLSEEFLQYWLGAYEATPAGGAGTDSGIAPVDGVRDPFLGLGWAFAGSGVAPGGNTAAYSASAETLGAAYPAVSGSTAARYRVRRPDTSAAARNGTGTAAAVETRSSLLFGFGFEDIATADQRAAVMGRALNFLLGPR